MLARGFNHSSEILFLPCFQTWGVGIDSRYWVLTARHGEYHSICCIIAYVLCLWGRDELCPLFYGWEDDWSTQTVWFFKAIQTGGLWIYMSFVLFFKSPPALKSLSWRPGYFGNSAESFSVILGVWIHCRKSLEQTFKGHAVFTIQVLQQHSRWFRVLGGCWQWGAPWALSVLMAHWQQGPRSGWLLWNTAHSWGHMW